MTCIAMLDSRYQYALMKMGGEDMSLEPSPYATGGRFAPAASLSINLLEPTS
jgi:hypothetical protein